MFSFEPVSVFVSFSLSIIPFPPLVQGSCVQVLPSAVWDNAIWPDPWAPGCPEKVLPADRPRVQYCTAARARARASADTHGSGDRYGGRRGGWGGGPVMLHHTNSLEHRTPPRAPCLRPVQPRCGSVSSQRPPGFSRTLGLKSQLSVGYLLPPTCTLNPRHNTNTPIHTNSPDGVFDTTIKTVMSCTRCSNASTG